MRKSIHIFVFVMMAFFAMTRNTFAVVQDATVVYDEKKIFIQQNMFTSINPISHSDYIGYYLSEEIHYTRISKKNLILLQTQIGLTLNHYFQWAVACSHVPQNFTVTTANYTQRMSGFWSCGNVFTFIPAPEDIFHVNFSLYLSEGQAFGELQEYYDPYQDDFVSPENKTYRGIYFFAIRPQVKFEMNIVENFRLGFDLAYRYVLAKDDAGLQNKASNFEFGASLALGLF